MKSSTLLKEVKIFSTFEVHKNYEELLSVIKIILVLSHGQSAIERSLSLGKSFIVENISEESIRNKKLINPNLGGVRGVGGRGGG